MADNMEELKKVEISDGELENIAGGFGMKSTSQIRKCDFWCKQCGSRIAWQRDESELKSYEEAHRKQPGCSNHTLYCG